MPEMGSVILFVNARSLDYNSRLIVYSVSIKTLTSLFSQKSTVNSAADATIVRLLQKNENGLIHLSSSSKLANPIFLQMFVKFDKIDCSPVDGRR